MGPDQFNPPTIPVPGFQSVKQMKEGEHDQRHLAI